MTQLTPTKHLPLVYLQQGISHCYTEAYYQQKTESGLHEDQNRVTFQNTVPEGAGNH